MQPAACQCAPRRRLIAPVAAHERGPAHQHFADLAWRQLAPVGVHHAQPVLRVRASAGTQAPERRVVVGGGEEGGQPQVLRHAVQLHQTAPQSLAQAREQRLGDRRGAVHQLSQRGQVARRDVRRGE